LLFDYEGTGPVQAKLTSFFVHRADAVFDCPDRIVALETEYALLTGSKHLFVDRSFLCGDDGFTGSKKIKNENETLKRFLSGIADAAIKLNACFGAASRNRQKLEIGRLDLFISAGAECHRQCEKNQNEERAPHGTPV